MKNQLLVSKYLFLVLATLSVVACRPVYSMSPAVNTPNFEKKGELTIEGFAGTGYGGQAAYALTNHWGIMGSGTYINQSNKAGDVSGSGHLIEAGTGYFDAFGKDNVFRFGTYVGYGRGEIQNNLKGFGSSKVNLVRRFIQPSIGYVTENRVFEFIYSLKLSRLRYSNHQDNYTDKSFSTTFDKLKKPYTIYENIFCMSVGSPKFKVFAQVVAAQAFNEATRLDLNLDSGIYLGLQARFNTVKSKK
jgi:hypothetical protein